MLQLQPVVQQVHSPTRRPPQHCSEEAEFGTWVDRHVRAVSMAVAGRQARMWDLGGQAVAGRQARMWDLGGQAVAGRH